MAHHRKRLRIRLGLPALVIGTATVVVVATTMAALAVHQSASAACSGMLDLGVTAAPAIAPVVDSVAGDFNDTRPSANGRCVRVSVDTEDSAQTAAGLPTARLDPPALWIPDSSLWARVARDQAAATGRGAPRLDIHGPLATTSLVLAAPVTLAHRLPAPSWRAVADGALPAVIGNPTTTTEGLTGVLLIESALGEQASTASPSMVSLLLRLGRSAVTDIAGEFTSDTGSVAFTATEQAVNQANRMAGRTEFAALRPEDGTFAFDYPVVRVVSATEPPDTSAAATEFENLLRSPATATMLAAAGFRAANAQLAGARPYPADQVVLTLLRTWLAVNLDARFLTVIDVSGSMGQPVTPGGETKAQIVRDATTIGIGEFPDSSEIGVWVFADQLDPPDDWREIVPIGPLGEPMDGVTRRVELQRVSAALPSLVHGFTALYSTAIAAYRTVRAGYDPGKINAVVLMTDGYNDTTHGPDLATTIATLRSLVDPAHPVPLFAIGIGPAADLNALRQLAAATNGRAYRVDTASDIVRVFLDALVQRTADFSQH